MENMDVPGLLIGNGCAGANCEAAGVKSDGAGFGISAGADGAATAKTGAAGADGAAEGARKGELGPGTAFDSIGANGANGEGAFPCGADGGSTRITPPIAGAGDAAGAGLRG